MRHSINLLAEPSPPATLLSPRPAPAAPICPPDASADPGLSEPIWLWQGYVPSLNGLRALSILLVIVSHLAHKPNTPFSYPFLHPLGGMGVEMFFVISGFLITLLLLREQRRQGTVSLTDFFLRRIFRIVPAYAFFLLVLVGMELTGLIHIPAISWLRAVTYTTSLFGFESGGQDLAHTWSLSVEEHFYLLWPGLFLLLGTRNSLLAAVGCVVLTPFLRFGLHYGFGASCPDFAYFTPTRMDAIAVGCCLAFGATSPIFRRATGLATRWSTVTVVAGILLILWLCRFPALFDDIKFLASLEPYLASTFKPIILAWLVWTCVRTPHSLVGKVLNGKFLNHLGILSYSLYLWQQVFLHPQRTHWICDWPFNICFAFVAALVSYFLIEKPFLALKERLALARTRRSPRTDEVKS